MESLTSFMEAKEFKITSNQSPNQPTLLNVPHTCPSQMMEQNVLSAQPISQYSIQQQKDARTAQPESKAFQITHAYDEYIGHQFIKPFQQCSLSNLYAFMKLFSVPHQNPNQILKDKTNKKLMTNIYQRFQTIFFFFLFFNGRIYFQPCHSSKKLIIDNFDEMNQLAQQNKQEILVVSTTCAFIDEGNFWTLISDLELQQYFDKMRAQTPQKKTNISINNKSLIKRNNSYSKNVDSSSHLYEQQSYENIFKPKQQKSKQIANQGIMIKKTPRRALGIGRKYAHQNSIFKRKTQTKQYREVVISEQFVRSSKIYRLLKEQVAISEAKHFKQFSELQEILNQQSKNIKELKSNNHQMKLELWELRNQLVEMKEMYEEEQQENNKLLEQIEYINQGGEEEEEGDEDGENDDDEEVEESHNSEQHIEDDEISMKQIPLEPLENLELSGKIMGSQQFQQ